jgi:hypothetical protein
MNKTIDKPAQEIIDAKKVIMAAAIEAAVKIKKAEEDLHTLTRLSVRDITDDIIANEIEAQRQKHNLKA